MLKENNLKRVCINNNCFNVEIAQSSREKARWLMERESLAEDAGMLFVYKEEAYRSFWMKNMNFPIDIIWINKDKEIVGITDNASVCKENCPSYRSPEKAMYVLEINGGLAATLDIAVKDKIILHH
jgi:uncharacterized protein